MNPFNIKSSTFNLFFLCFSFSIYANPIVDFAKNKQLQYSSRIKDRKYVTIIDFSKPITDERLYVVDIKKGSIILKCRVAHGIGSGSNYAVKFSDVEESKMSSLGAFISTNTYYGKFGYSLKLK